MTRLRALARRTGHTREVRRLIRAAWPHALHNNRFDLAFTILRIERLAGERGMWRLLCHLADRVIDAWTAATGEPYRDTTGVVVPGWYDATTGGALYPSTDGEWCGWWVAARANRDLDQMHALLDPLGPTRRPEKACALASRAAATVQHLEQAGAAR